MPTPYPLYNTLNVIDYYPVSIGKTDSILGFYFYDSSHRVTKYESFLLGKNGRENDSQVVYTYDSGGAYMSVVKSYFDSRLNKFVKDHWINARYDSIGNIVYFYSGSFIGDSLEIYDHERYHYDSKGRTTMIFFFDPINGNNTKYHYFYDSSNSGFADTQFSWNSQKGIWVKESVEKWIETKSGKDSIYDKKIWSGKWVNNEHTVYYYDSLSRNIKTIDVGKWRDSIVYGYKSWTVYHDDWNSLSKSWQQSYQDINNGSPDTFCAFHYDWDGVNKKYILDEDRSPVCREYDAKGSLRHLLANVYNGKIADTWTYDNNQRISFYSDFGRYYYNQRIWYYYYPKYTSIADATPGIGNVQIYPNPSSGIYNLNFPEKFIGELTVYDMLGNMRYHQNISGQKKASFELSVPAGIYLLKLEDKDGNFATMKLIKY